MLFIPKYTASYTQKSGVHLAISKLAKLVDIKKVNFLQLFDKSTLDSDQHDLLRLVPKTFLLIFFAFSLLAIKLWVPQAQPNLFYNSRYSYISFRSFRI
jgi:hypothetical protein